MSDLRYPIGKFEWAGPPTKEERARMIGNLESQPERLRAAVEGLSDEQLDTPYRDGGWTLRQVVHHVADSHMNAYVRTRLGLTEAEPLVKPYDEARWAELPDARSAPVAASLTLFEALHKRWVMLLRSLSDSDFAREYQHPEDGPVSLHKMLAVYAWHGSHHIAHITSLRARMGWR
jgi:uncharacterized damage-inducible protein DinB